MPPYERLYFVNRVRNLFQNERTSVSHKDAPIIGLPQDGGVGGGGGRATQGNQTS